MDEDPEEKQELSNQHTQNCLFPISSYASSVANSPDLQGRLFPCDSLHLQTAGREGIQVANLDWLSNQSYHALSHGKPYLDTHEDSDNLSSISDHEETSHKKSRPYRKRRKTNSESSNERSTKSKHKKKGKKKKKKQKRQEPDKHIVEADEKLKPDTIWIEESGLKPEEAYRMHSKKDVENLMYGSIYRLDVATYKMKSNSVCLGLGKNQSVLINESKKKKNKRTKEKEKRYWNSSELFSEAPKQLLPSKSASKLFVGNVENFSYVPIDLPSSRENDDDDDDDNDGDIDDNIDASERAIIKETANLNKILRENPNDIKTWIDLANFQAKVVNKKDSNTAAGNESSKKHSKLVSEKQISVVEKALEQNPSSVELIIYHLDLCKDVWDDGKLMERWKKTVFSHPNKTTLWRKYLLFLQSRVSIFTLKKVQKAYEKCFAMLLSIKEGRFVSHQAEDSLEEDMLDLFVQYCQFLKQSGHIEKCVASFQAMVELNCLCPEELVNSTTSGSLEFLETFWDSGQPRFGEPGAVGWKTWMNKTTKPPLQPEILDLKKIFKSYNSTSDPEYSDSKEEELVKDEPKWKAWINVEVNRERAQLKPWQPDQTRGETEDDCEDPERIVLFEDIESCLFKISDVQCKVKLVSCFLETLGVAFSPVCSSSAMDISRYFELSLESLDQVISPSDFTTGIGWQKSGYWYNQGKTTLNKPSFEALALIRHIFVQLLALFEGKYESHFIITWLNYEIYLCQLESTGKTRKQRIREIYKLAKAILKEPRNRNNFQVWEVFAKITSFSGDVSESQHVFDSTLSMASQLQINDKERQMSLVTLYRSYAEMELKKAMKSKETKSLGLTGTPSNQSPASKSTKGTLSNQSPASKCTKGTSSNQPTASESTKGTSSTQKALHILISFVDNNSYIPLSETIQSVSPAKVLRAKKAYAQICEESINGLIGLLPCGEDMSLRRVHCIACCAMFAYLTSGVSAAVAVYEKVLSSLSSSVDAFGHEFLWSDYINLVKMHTKYDSLSLKKIKPLIYRAITAFPNNPMFLDYYLQVQLKSNLTGEVRRFFDHLTHSATSPLPWMFAISFEDRRQKAMLTARDCKEYTKDIKGSHTLDRQTVLNMDRHSLSSSMGGQPVCVTSLPMTGVRYRQRALFDRATSCSTGRHCIGLWRMYIEFELGQGNHEQAKAVFYQALQNCAWAKSLYLDGVKAFPDDLQHIVDMMTEMEMRVRTPLEEIDILMNE